MITKTIFFAKTFGCYSMQILRQKKSLRDHETGRKPAYHPQDTGRPNGHAGGRASRRAGGRAGGRRRPAAPGRGPPPERDQDGKPVHDGKREHGGSGTTAGNPRLPGTRGQTPATNSSHTRTATALTGFLLLPSPPHQGRVRPVHHSHLAQTDADPPPRTRPLGINRLAVAGPVAEGIAGREHQ
jgi:hypothetical protein